MAKKKEITEQKFNESINAIKSDEDGYDDATSYPHEWMHEGAPDDIPEIPIMKDECGNCNCSDLRKQVADLQEAVKFLVEQLGESRLIGSHNVHHDWPSLLTGWQRQDLLEKLGYFG